MIVSWICLLNHWITVFIIHHIISEHNNHAPRFTLHHVWWNTGQTLKWRKTYHSSGLLGLWGVLFHFKVWSKFYYKSICSEYDGENCWFDYNPWLCIIWTHSLSSWHLPSILYVKLVFMNEWSNIPPSTIDASKSVCDYETHCIIN